jgi:hypothetical protein
VFFSKSDFAIFMKPSDAFELIQSLSMSEKRQFVVYANRHVIGESNKYLSLFHLLQEMPVYDELQLINLVKKQGLVAKYLKADEHYLYQLLLESLVMQHDNKSANLLVKSALLKIEILFDKGLYRQCKKEIVKAIAISIKYELFEYHINLLLWERKAQVMSPAKNYAIHSLHEKITLAITQLQHFTTYTKLYDKAVELRQSVIKTRTAFAIQKFKKLLQHDLLLSPAKQSVQMQIRYHQIYAMWYYIHKDKTNELMHNKHIIQLLDKHPHFKEEYPLDFIAIYSRILSITKSGPAITFEKELTAFRSFKPLSQSITYDNIVAQIFTQSYMIQVSQLLSNKLFYTAGRILPELQTGIRYHKRFINPVTLLSLYFITAYTAFANGNLTIARQYVNNIINEFDDSLRPDIYNFSRLLNLMLHLELRNYSNIKSEYASVSYYFNKNKQLFKTENLVLSYFSNPKNYMYNSNGALLVLQDNLEKIKEIKIEQFALNYIDFFTWIKARLSRQPMAEVK